MRFKTTKKEVRANYDVIIEAPYCVIQNLLRFTKNTAYVSGNIGWLCDIYEVRTKEGKPVAISTGYGPFGNVKPDYDLCTKYDRMALKIPYGTYEDEKAEHEKLIEDFLEEAIGGRVR